ncbi:Uncharacterised protein [Burkholderia pseudomallei]|nr:Uncharacterised protein [Burkholderia pseudomallei]
MAKKHKNAKIVNSEIEVEGIPFGIISVDDFLQDPFTQNLISSIKKDGNDPIQCMTFFLVSYQIVDIKAQLMAKGQYALANDPEALDHFFEMASTNVLVNYSGILAAIGEKTVARLFAMFANNEATND